MATITILANKGFFNYEDYQQGRAALRIDELQTDQVQSIYRSDNDPLTKKGPVAVLVSAAWYKAQLALFAAASQSVPANFVNTQTDDYLGGNSVAGGNLSKMINYLNGTAEVPANVAATNALGTTRSEYLVYAIIRTQKFEDNNGANNPSKYQDADATAAPVAYLLNPVFFTAVQAGPT